MANNDEEVAAELQAQELAGAQEDEAAQNAIERQRRLNEQYGRNAGNVIGQELDYEEMGGV